ncbi:glutamate synthase small subunit, partial [Vibrio astriarenae]
LNTEVGKDIDMATLVKDYDAVFLGVGTYKNMRAGLTNEEASGVFDALPFLISNTYKVMELEASDPFIDMKGKKVVVLGGG